MPTFSLIKLVFTAAWCVVLAGSAAYITHRVDASKLEKVELQYAQAQTKAVTEAKALQAQEEGISLSAAVAEAQAQQKIVTVTQTITKEVVRHVTDHSDCITYGLVRVLDAGTNGVDPDTLALPAGKSDDACAPVTASSLATGVLNNYGLARANAEQLNALEAWVTATTQASHAGSTRAGATVSGAAGTPLHLHAVAPPSPSSAGP